MEDDDDESPALYEVAAAFDCMIAGSVAMRVTSIDEAWSPLHYNGELQVQVQGAERFLYRNDLFVNTKHVEATGRMTCFEVIVVSDAVPVQIFGQSL